MLIIRRQDMEDGDAIDERATEAMKKGSNNQRKAHMSGWKLDNDGWYVKKFDARMGDKVSAAIRTLKMRAFVSDSGDEAVMGEVTDCLKIDRILRGEKIEDVKEEEETIEDLAEKLATTFHNGNLNDCIEGILEYPGATSALLAILVHHTLMEKERAVLIQMLKDRKTDD